MRPPPEMFFLKQDARLLGNVRVRGIWDMFWFKIDFEPSDAFTEFAPLFERSIQALDYGGDGDFDDLWEAILARGIVLVRADDETIITSFILHIDRGNSRLRYVEPSDLQD